jgi:thioredoxin-like negative regulator of GroEL
MITKVTSENFEREVVNSARPCVLKFYNDGCHLCTALRASA